VREKCRVWFLGFKELVVNFYEQVVLPSCGIITSMLKTDY
jgi:hypothetical protein